MERKFNRKFTRRVKRMEHWYNLEMKLSEFDGLVNNYDGASPDEVRTLKTIHQKLYECQLMVKVWRKETEKC